MVQDGAKAAVNSRERLSQELQTKQAQVCSLEGQLDAARTLNNKLSQEVKRLESEEFSGNYKFVLFEPIVYFHFLINRVTNHCQYTMLIPQFSFICLPIFLSPSQTGGRTGEAANQYLLNRYNSIFYTLLERSLSLGIQWYSPVT